MSYALGGKVQSTDLNSFTTTFNALWSTGSSNSGYGQTAIPSVSYGEKVRANSYWRALVQNIEASANHQGSAISAMTPTPTTAGKIQFLSTLNSNLTTINNNRLNAASSGSTSITTLTSIQSWDNSLVMTFNVTFANNNAARYFFNSGGQIGFNFSHPDTGSINTLISDICAEAGTIWVSSPTSGTATISGTAYNGVTKVGGVSSVRQTVNTNYGFYAFNSTSTEIFKQTGDAGSYSYYFDSFLQIKASTNSAGVVTFVCTIDEIPDGVTVATGTVGTLTLRPPSTTYISNSWGTPSVAGTLVYNNVPVTQYVNQGTSGTVQLAYTIPLNAGGVGENFYRIVGSWTATYGGTVYVDYLTWAGAEKVWDMQFTRVRNSVRTTIQVNSYGSGAFYTGGDSSGCYFTVPGPWVQYVGAVDVLPGDKLEGYCYLWGAFNSDHIEGGNFNVWGTVVTV